VTEAIRASKEISAKKYVVRLSTQEREQLKALIRKERARRIGKWRRECLDRRIADKQTLIGEIAAWEQDRNANHTKANWRQLSPTTNSWIWMFGRLSAPSAAPLRTISRIGSNSAD
jgi:hypothetical protein